MNRKLGSDPTFYACAVPFALLLGSCVFVWSSDEYALWRELWVCRLSGYGSLAFLFVALAITPVRRIAALFGRRAPQAALLALRRRAGITSALLAMAHSGGALLTYLDGSWVLLLRWPFTRAGVLAVVILMLLLVTSFPRVVSLLRVKVWSQLHRLAYVAALAVFQHLFFAPFGSAWWAASFLVVIVVLLCTRFLPARSVRSRSATPTV